MIKVYFIWFIVFLSCGRGRDSEMDTNTKFKSSRNLTKIKFFNKRVDFGYVNSDTLLTGKYIFMNSGNFDLIIDYVSPDCSCTDFYLSKKSIKPGDTAYILLKLLTKSKFGNEKIFATVSANTEERLYSLQLLVNIKENLIK